jgi:hypothetical protein
MRFPSLPVVLLGLILATTFAVDANAKPTAKEAKVNIYVEILNAESKFIFDTRSSYAKWVDMKTGPTCQEIGLRGPGSIGDSAPERYAHYRKELAKKPKLDADDAAVQMVEALEQLREPTNEASDYYFKRKFRDDGCKRGKELHPMLLAGWQKYGEAYSVVHAFVAKFNDEREATDLANAEKKYGKGFHYTHTKLMIDGKAVIRAVEAQLDKEKFEVPVLKEKLATFGQSITDGKALVAKEKGGKNADAIYQGGYEQLLSKAGWFQDSINELFRQLDKPANDPTSNAENRKRTVKQIFDSYNGMVDQSNGVMYSKGMK